MNNAEREELAQRLEDEIRPLLGIRPSWDDDEERGYDCCGCSTYDWILDHAIAVVRGTDFAVPTKGS